jgi:hypothetical protein
LISVIHREDEKGMQHFRGKTPRGKYYLVALGVDERL